MKALIAAGLTISLLTGCASIIKGGHQDVKFSSVPDGASISITNRNGQKIEAGNTPITVKLKRSAGYFKAENYTVRFEKDGFHPKEARITSSVNGWYLGNIIFGGLIGMLIVDPITGGMYALSPKDVAATLDALQIQTTSNEQSLTIVLAQELPEGTWESARRIQ